MRAIGEEAKLQEKMGKKPIASASLFRWEMYATAQVVLAGQDQKHLSISKRSLSG